MDVDNVVDVVGVVLDPGTWGNRTNKDKSKEYKIKTVVIGDHSGYKCNVDIFGGMDDPQFDVNEGDIIKISKVKLAIFRSKKLTSIRGETTFTKDPDENEHTEIKQLYEFLKHNNVNEFNFQKFPTEGDVYTDVYPANIIRIQEVLNAMDNVHEQMTLPMKKFL